MTAPYGHRAGEAVLQSVSRILTAHLAEYGSSGRLCGEEFALIASNASLEQIIAARGDLLRTIETTPFVTPGGVVQTTMSAAIASRDLFEPFERLYGGG